MLPADGLAIAVCLSCAISVAHAGEDLKNWGNDPFFKVSDALAHCPEPAGPRVSEKEWMGESHHRIEHASHCWLEWRCRLPNAFDYGDEIASSVRRRLTYLGTTMPEWQQSTLWVTVYERWILVQGCVTSAFPRKRFLDAIGEVPDA